MTQITQEKQKTITEAIDKLLAARLQIFVNDSLNDKVFMEIYVMIFNTFVEVFQQANVQLSNEAMNYVAQQYYDMLSFNDSVELKANPNIFDKRAKLEDIKTPDIALLATFFRDSPHLYIPMYKEIKKRS